MTMTMPRVRPPSRHDRLAELFEAHHTAVLGYATRRAASAEQAADVFSEVFLVAWRRLDDVPPGEEAKLWLFGVARRALANARRASRRHDRLVERLAATLPASAFVTPRRTSHPPAASVPRSTVSGPPMPNWSGSWPGRASHHGRRLPSWA